MTENYKEKILVIDDEVDALENCQRILHRSGYIHCITEKDPLIAIELIEKVRPDVVITDLKMPQKDGIEILKAAKAIDPGIVVILFTAYGTIETAVEAIKEGAFDYIPKPFTAKQLEVAIERALTHKRLLEENRNLREQLAERFNPDRIIGQSEAMREVFDVMRKVSRTNANILISGESGTGKELIARCIHANSLRLSKPFIPVDCAALPGDLLESELFGHEKGAFTGAHAAKPGLFELADGGTLFLDEIASMGLNLQAKLLRALQERQVRRVGGTKQINVDIRLISATNRDPAEATRKDEFRKDLYYRLNVILISLPPLRCREGDIQLLADHFLKQFSRTHQKGVESISPDAMRLLERYHWPGNVRELQNVIERSVALADGPAVLPDHLPEAIRSYHADHAGAISSPDKSSFKEAKQSLIESFEREYLINLIKKHHGRIDRSAFEAGVDRKTIERLLKRYGLKASDL